MLLNDIYYEAGEIEHNATGKPSWAKPYGQSPQTEHRGPRRLVGQALINLGRAISPEPQATAAAQLRLTR